MTTLPYDTNTKEAAGALVLEGAILKFLSTAEPDVKAAFTEFVQTNQESPTLLQDIEATYPAFADILIQETEAMRSDMTSE